MAVVSVSLPESLLEQMDGLIRSRGFAGRSEVVRAALREFVAKQFQEPALEGERSATLTLVYPEEESRRIGEIRHDYDEVVKSMMHAHSGKDCVEVFMLHGRAERIREFSDRLRAHRESRLVEVAYTDVGGEVERTAPGVGGTASGASGAGRTRP